MKICDMFKLQKRKVTVLGLLLEKTHAQCYSVFATISNKTCCLVKWTELYDIHILHTLEWKCARYSSICRRHFVPAKFRTIPNSTDCKLIELNMTLWNFRQVYSPKLDLKIKNHSALERFISTHGVLWATVSCDLHLDTVLRQKKNQNSINGLLWTWKSTYPYYMCSVPLELQKVTDTCHWRHFQGSRTAKSSRRSKRWEMCRLETSEIMIPPDIQPILVWIKD